MVAQGSMALLPLLPPSIISQPSSFHSTFVQIHHEPRARRCPVMWELEFRTSFCSKSFGSYIFEYTLFLFDRVLQSSRTTVHDVQFNLDDQACAVAHDFDFYAQHGVAALRFREKKHWKKGFSPLLSCSSLLTCL